MVSQEAFSCNSYLTNLITCFTRRDAVIIPAVFEDNENIHFNIK